MTGMLASVNSVIEAKSILDLGVDIIDIKNPREGALGALETSAIKDIVKTVAGQTLTSATIGDIKSDDPNLPETILTMARTGVDYVKVGLFEIEPSEYFIEKITEAAKNGIKLVIVVFAENYKSIELIAPLFNSGIVGIMLDTKEKSSKNLCALLNSIELNEFIETAKEYGLLTGLAGSLKYEDIQTLLTLNSDYLGFRGALCSESNRINSIDKVQVNKIRNKIPFSGFNNFKNIQLKEAII